jgi:hypothetical protein
MILQWIGMVEYTSCGFASAAHLPFYLSVGYLAKKIFSDKLLQSVPAEGVKVHPSMYRASFFSMAVPLILFGI